MLGGFAVWLRFLFFEVVFRNGDDSGLIFRLLLFFSIFVFSDEMINSGLSMIRVTIIEYWFFTGSPHSNHPIIVFLLTLS